MELTAAPIRLDTFADPEASWEAARAAVDGGRPGDPAHRPLLPGPLRQLGALPRPRRGPRRLRRRGRLPLRHLVRGASDDAPRQPRPSPPRQASRSSRSTGTCSRSRRAPSWATSARPRRTRSRATPSRCSILRWASTRACRRCAGSPPRSATGPNRLEDWQWCARFCYQVIERRGTGGGNFRLMYSRFLDEAGRDEAPLAAEAAGRWTTLAEHLLAASEADEPRPELWSRVGAAAAEVLDAEERLWPALAAQSEGSPLRPGSAPAGRGSRARRSPGPRTPCPGNLRSPAGGCLPRPARSCAWCPRSPAPWSPGPGDTAFPRSPPRRSRAARRRPPPGRRRRGRAPDTGRRSPACRSPACRTS